MNSVALDVVELPEVQAVLTKQNWNSYSQLDHETWAELYREMTSTLENLAIEEFFDGLRSVCLSTDQIVKFENLSKNLRLATGWEYVAVPGFIPTDIFFKLLANRKFPSSCFMRQLDGMSYQELPDIFHDVYGHAPLLMNPATADFVQAFGVAGCNAKSDVELVRISRLYWFTVEVGLMYRNNRMQVYGAAIASSKKETLFSLNDTSPNRVWFDADRVMRTPYSMYDLQETYFVIPNVQSLIDIAKGDFKCVRESDLSSCDYERGQLVPTDKIIHRGTQVYHDGLKQVT